MSSKETGQTTDTTRESEGGMSRRSMLKSSTVAVAGAAGVGVASTSVAGQWFGGGGSITELDFRNGTPSVSEAPVDDEVVFYAHGYFGSGNSVGQASNFQTTAESLGYDGEVVAMTWSDAGGPGTAETNGREDGRAMGEFLDDYKDQNPDTNVRTLGYSMGGFVVMEMLAGLSRNRIENADMIGSWEVSDAPCEGNFYSDIEDSCVRMSNYYSTNDNIARLGGGTADCGFGGTPSNYYDVDVSSSVGSHGGYKSSSDCVQTILDNYVDDGGTTGTSGTSTTSSGGGGWWGSGDSGGSSGGSGWWS